MSPWPKVPNGISALFGVGPGPMGKTGMSSELSRRSFLALGTLGAAIAGTALVPTGAASAALPTQTSPSTGTGSGDRSPYALASWQQIGADRIRVNLPHGGSTTLRTSKVTDRSRGLPSAQGDEFALAFAVEGVVPNEGTYILSHASLGTFPLFLSPADKGQVTALVNRSHGVNH